MLFKQKSWKLHFWFFYKCDEKGNTFWDLTTITNNFYIVSFLEISGQQLSNLWSLLEKLPSIIVQKNSPESWELAQKLQNEIEINTVAALDTKSIMLIMDRGMDLVAPLVHDITFQVCKALYYMVSHSKDGKVILLWYFDFS